MRVLMLSWEYPPFIRGGLGTHVKELLTAFGQNCPKDFLAIDLIVPGIAGGEAWESVNSVVTVYRINEQMSEPDPYLGVMAFNRLLHNHAIQIAGVTAYDLIHVHDWLTGSAGMSLKHQWNIPLVVTFHNVQYRRDTMHALMSNQINQLQRQMCMEANQIIVSSKFMREELHYRLDVPYAKIHVIPNGVNVKVDESCTAEELTALHRRYAPAGEKLLFFIGQVSRQKGLLVLLRALPSILTDYPNTRLLVAGENGDKLWPLVYELNLEQSVQLLGYIPDHERDCLYQVVDAAIFPSLHEPFGIVALEAMALGCNVIASNVGGLGEVVKHTETGLLIPPNDHQALARAVHDLFTDPMAAEKRRARAMQEIETTFRWDKIAVQIAEVYDLAVEFHL